MPLSTVAARARVLVTRVVGAQAQQWLLLAGLLEGDRVTVLSVGADGDRVVARDDCRVYVPARVARQTLVARLDEERESQD